MLSLASLSFHPVAFSEYISFMNPLLVILEQDNPPRPFLIICFLGRGCPLYAKKETTDPVFFPRAKTFLTPKVSESVQVSHLLSPLMFRGNRHVQYSLGSENKLSLCAELYKHAWGEGSKNISITLTDNHL